MTTADMLHAERMHITGRAIVAYCRRAGADIAQPADARAEVETIDGKHYAVLRGGGAVLAIYRVRRDGKLKRLRQYPRQFTE